MCIYIYVCVCVCVCVYISDNNNFLVLHLQLHSLTKLQEGLPELLPLFVYKFIIKHSSQVTVSFFHYIYAKIFFGFSFLNKK